MQKKIYITSLVVAIFLTVLLLSRNIFVLHEKVQVSAPNVNMANNAVVEKRSTSTVLGRTSTTTSVATGWLTYNNKTEGFLIDYPVNFGIQEVGSGGAISFGVNFGDKEAISFGRGEISIGKSEMYKTFDKYFKDIQDPYKIDKVGSVDGRKAMFYSYTSSGINKFIKEVAIQDGKNFWIISIDCFNENFKKIPSDMNGSEVNNILSVDDYEKVINSFKFLK